MNTPAPPAWLFEEPEIEALLQAVLKRFDAQPGVDRQRGIFMSAQAHLPSLRQGDLAAEQTWILIEALAEAGILQIRTARRRSEFDPQWVGAKLVFAPAAEGILRNWLKQERLEPARRAWQAAVADRAHEFPGSASLLMLRRIAIRGRSDREVVDALLQAATLVGPLSLRQLSARLFWGDSKVLDDRAELIAALFPQLQIRERPIVVAVYLPERVGGVLFIENQDSYAMAAAGAIPTAQDLALVYAAGFRGGAARIRNPAAVLLHCAGPGASQLRETVEQSWFDVGEMSLPTWFWGDLDFAGMQILKALRVTFGNVNGWEPGYASMLDALPLQGSKREWHTQSDPGSTGCPYADERLLPAIRQYGFLDQEWLVPRC